MLFNTNINGDPRSFMYFNEEWYINGTEITLTESYIKNHKFNGKKLWKYARFDHVTTYNNQKAYFFCRSKYSFCDLLQMGYNDVQERTACQKDYAPYFVITAYEIEYAIDEFTKPIKLSKEETEARKKAIEYMIEHPKRDWDYPELLVMWLVYIIVLLGSLIFNEFYLVWIVATLIFHKLRKEIIENK